MTLEEIKKQLRTQPKSGHLQREMMVDDKSINKENCYAEFSVSSETPVLRWFGYEILDHSETSINMGRLQDGAAHRDGHYGDQIGVIEKAWVDPNERKLRVGVRFSQNTARAIEIWKDICDGIRRNVSIDYEINEIRFEREEGDVSYYRVTSWEPIHTCSTPDGADQHVGVGRSKDSKTGENGSDINILINNNRGKNPMTDEEKKQAEEALKAAQAEARRSAAEKETLRIKGIRMMAHDLQRNIPGVKLEDEAEKFIQQDKTEIEFYNFCREKMRDPEAVRKPDTHIDLSEREKNQYDLARAILAQADGKVDTLGIEKEVSDTLKRTVNSSSRGLLIPTNLMTIAPEQNFKGQRAASFLAGTASQGGNAVNEEPIAQSFIEYLHNNLVAIQAGVVFMPGMTGDVPFIRELDQMVARWIAESTTYSATGITYSRVLATPKNIAAKTSLSRQMLLQSPYVNEPYVNRKLFGAISRGIDRDIFYGPGTTGRVAGVKNISGVHSAVGAAFDRSRAISMKSAIRADNAEIGTVCFCANPVTAGVLQDKPIAANYPAFLLNDENIMVGRSLCESNQIDEGDLFYGAWSTLYLLEWGYLEVSSNPYGSGWDAGDIEVRALHAVDVFAEYPQSLNVAEGVN